LDRKKDKTALKLAKATKEYNNRNIINPKPFSSLLKRYWRMKNQKLSNGRSWNFARRTGNGLRLNFV